MQKDIEIKKTDQIKLNIEKLIYGGDGFTHIGSRACFVKDAVPGDEIIAEINAVKKQYLNASIHELLRPSDKRTEPPCPYYSNCGGCQWQHIEYDYQLYWKQEIIKESLSRIGNISDIKINNIIPAPFKYSYRTRTIMQVNGKSALPGYFMRNSHEIIKVKSCLLLEEPINTALSELSETISNITAVQKIKDIEFMYLKQGNKVIVSFNTLSKNSRHKPIIYDLNEQTLIDKADLVETVNGLKFIRNPRRFYQINYQQNINLIMIVEQFFTELNDPVILDLYCGCGNFSLFLAKNGAKVSGVDFDRKVIQEAVQNSKANNIKTCSFKAYDLSKHSSDIYKSRYNGVLLNPPRTGATKNVLEHIISIDPEVIVYVSCNPATLARDLKILCDKKYQLIKVQPVDQFPQTYHIETVVKLVKR